jgi:hypothetical protein
VSAASRSAKCGVEPPAVKDSPAGGGLYAPLLTALFSEEPALKRGTLLAAIWIFSPVCGFTP